MKIRQKLLLIFVFLLLICCVTIYTFPKYFPYLRFHLNSGDYGPGFDQTNCLRPCWYGIQAGVSSKDDVKKVVSSLPPEFESIRVMEGVDEYSNQSYIDFYFKVRGNIRRWLFLFNQDGNEILDYIDFGKNAFIFEDARKIFGDPDVALAYAYPFQSASYNKKELHFLYIDKGIYLNCSDKRSGYFLPKDYSCGKYDSVTFVFFAPELYKDMLALAHGDAAQALKYTRPYQGLDVRYPIMEGDVVPP